nr:hypothetical protein [uncultured Holophaga sp.]
MRYWLLSGLFLAGLLGCEPQPRGVCNGPAEAGLVLGYENPSLPEAQRAQDRLQVRVDATQVVEGGLDVQASLSSLRGQAPQRFFLRKGGLAVWDGKSIQRVLLPEGFPAVRSWTAGGAECRVIGRAIVPKGIPLPPDSNRIGTWVEISDPGRPGSRSRSLFVPGVGLVETCILREGRWVTVQQLCSRMFTEVPTPR